MRMKVRMTMFFLTAALLGLVLAPPGSARNSSRVSEVAKDGFWTPVEELFADTEDEIDGGEARDDRRDRGHAEHHHHGHGHKHHRHHEEGEVPRPGLPCGTSGARPRTYEHVIWIVFENQDYGSVIGSSDAPYTNLIASECGLATNFFAETHPSLPNYIAMTSGSTQGITDDEDPASHPLSVPSIFSQLGSDWRSLEESMPSNCLRSNFGEYAVRHNPAAYYTNVDCAAQDVPLTSVPDLSARFTFVTPNVCNDTHDCPVQTGDAWLSGFLPKIIESPEYEERETAVFITWDEDNGGSSNHIPTLVLSPFTRPGTQAVARYDHYSMLRTTEELLGMDEFLGGAATAASMREDFHLLRRTR
jgi:phosphatidylinositol-3-phosphatase